MYVDDVIITCKNKANLSRIRSLLFKEFKMTDLGPLNYVLFGHDDKTQKWLYFFRTFKFLYEMFTLLFCVIIKVIPESRILILLYIVEQNFYSSYRC